MDIDSDLPDAPQFIMDNITKARGIYVVILTDTDDILWNSFGKVAWAELAYVAATMTKEAVRDE